MRLELVFQDWRSYGLTITDCVIQPHLQFLLVCEGILYGLLVVITYQQDASPLHILRLKYLNLDNNELVSIPHLKLLGTGILKEQAFPSKDDNFGEIGNALIKHEMSSSSLAPFPQLQTLSLCNNMVQE